MKRRISGILAMFMLIVTFNVFAIGSFASVDTVNNTKMIGLKVTGLGGSGDNRRIYTGYVTNVTYPENSKLVYEVYINANVKGIGGIDPENEGHFTRDDAEWKATYHPINVDVRATSYQKWGERSFTLAGTKFDTLIFAAQGADLPANFAVYYRNIHIVNSSGTTIWTLDSWDSSKAGPRDSSGLSSWSLQLYDKADYSEINSAKYDYDPADLTTDSAKKLNDALSAIDFTKGINDQAIVDGYVAPFMSAITGLKYNSDTNNNKMIRLSINGLNSNPFVYIGYSKHVEYPSKSKLIYDVYIDTKAKGIGCIDPEPGSGGPIRDNAEYKQTYHPINVDVSESAYCKWYERSFELAGTSFDSLLFAAEGSTVPSSFTVYYKNIRVVDPDGAVVWKFGFVNNDNVYRYACSIGNFNGYSLTLLNKADYTKVDASIAKIPTDLSLYSDSSVKTLNDARNAVVKDKGPIDQSTVDGYAAPILNAINALKYKDADYGKVNAAIAKIPADLSAYTEDSVKALNDARNAVVTGLEITDQETVDNCAAAIESAIAGLKYKDADYSKVRSANSKIPSDLSIYTDESVKALRDAVNAVVEGKNITEQAKVDSYAAAIESAINGLEKKSVKSADSTSKESTPSPSNTGDDFSIVLLLVLLTVAVGGVLLCSKSVQKNTK